MEQPFGTFRHEYSKQQRRLIEKELSISDLDLLQLQNAAAQYKFDRSLNDPNSEDSKRAVEDYQEFLTLSRKQLPIIDRLHRRRPLLPVFDAKDDPSLRDGWPGLKALLLVYMEVAEAESSPDPRFRKSANRSRSKGLDIYFEVLLDFWMGRGGHPGKSERSPAVRFILAAATPVIPDLKASTVSQFIRDEVKARSPKL
jgi:hypothetical protein